MTTGTNYCDRNGQIHLFLYQTWYTSFKHHLFFWITESYLVPQQPIYSKGGSMKKLSLFILCFMISLNSFAAASGNQELIQVFDEYHYSVTVEWDQKDEKKLAELTDGLYKNLDKLTLGKGMNPKNIEALIISRVQNSAAVEAAKLKLRLLGSNPSSAELVKFLKEEGKNMYAQGSSWNGDATIIAGLAVFWIAIIAYNVWFHANHECVRWEQEFDGVTCSQSSYVNDYGDRIYYGSDNCSNQYVDICAEWVKK